MITLKNIEAPVRALMREVPKLKAEVQISSDALHYAATDIERHATRDLARHMADEVFKVADRASESTPDPYFIGRGHGKRLTASVYAMGEGDLAVLLTRAYEAGRRAK